MQTETLLRVTGAAGRDDDQSTVHSVPCSSSAATKRLVSSSRELGILGLPPEKMALVREKKDDIEKVTCYVVHFTFVGRKVILFQLR